MASNALEGRSALELGLASPSWDKGGGVGGRGSGGLARSRAGFALSSGGAMSDGSSD